MTQTIRTITTITTSTTRVTSAQNKLMEHHVESQGFIFSLVLECIYIFINIINFHFSVFAYACIFIQEIVIVCKQALHFISVIAVYVKDTLIKRLFCNIYVKDTVIKRPFWEFTNHLDFKINSEQMWDQFNYYFDIIKNYYFYILNPNLGLSLRFPGLVIGGLYSIGSGRKDCESRVSSNLRHFERKGEEPRLAQRIC